MDRRTSLTMKPQKIFCLLLVFLANTAACIAADARQTSAPQSTEPVLPVRAYELYYGVYLNGHKVGWMRTAQQVAEEIELTQEVHAEVAGMGQVSTIEVRESRNFDKTSGELRGLSFKQKAATGSVLIEGRAKSGVLKLEVQASTSKQKQELPVFDNYKDVLALENLVRAANPGTTINRKHFDPSLLQSIDVEQRVISTEQKLIGGFTAKTVQIETNYQTLGVKESAWLDQNAQVLETHVGGFFVARLEPPDVAKNLDYQQDLLVSAVVKAPRELTHPQDLEKLQLTFEGFGTQTPPQSTRQRIVSKNGTLRITLQRDPEIPATPMIKPTSVANENLRATPFIQVDDPAIQKAAKEAVGDATDYRRAISRLASFVYEHIRDEYVPAYSNALEALTSGRGDCTEHSILFVALARAVGIPARVAVGIAYWPPGKGFGWHAWSEVQVGDRWYTVDPTWNQPIADATHVKLADGGPAEQAKIVMLLGQLKITEMN